MKEVTFKELRLKKKLTQEQLAEKSGFSKDYISMIERGERNPRVTGSIPVRATR